MTKGELTFAIAKWAQKYHESIDLNDWAVTEDDANRKAKQELQDILEKANCEHIYMSSEKVMPDAVMSIQIPHTMTFKGCEWVDKKDLLTGVKIGNDRDLILHYGEK